MSRIPRILVVDDDEPILVLMKNILREFQFEPLISSSGADALAIARAENPELILLDINMPGMSGHTFIERLRAETQLTNVPVLILSGETLAPADLEAIGAQGAIQKPFDLSLLIERIRRAISPSEVPSQP